MVPRLFLTNYAQAQEMPDLRISTVHEEMEAGVCPMPSKYKNRRTVVDGIIFDSLRELKRYGELKMLERSGIISRLECHPRFPIVVSGLHICIYEADFQYVAQDGKQIVEDSKGVRTALFIIKSKLMLAVHGIRIVEV